MGTAVGQRAIRPMVPVEPRKHDTDQGGSIVARLAKLAIGLPRSTKRLILLGTDAILLPTALWSAMALRIGHLINPLNYGEALVWMALCGLGSISVMGLYRAVTRFIGMRVIGRTAAAITIATLAFALLETVASGWHVSYSTLAVYWAFALLFIAGSRAGIQHLSIAGQNTGTRKRIAIYGAGEAGARLCRFLLGSPEFQVVGFVDDNPSLQGSQINGITIHPSEKLPALVTTRNVDRVLLAMPSVSRRRRREILARLEPLAVHVQSLPDMADFISGTARIDDLRDVDVADLLGRDPVPPDPLLFDRCIRGKNVLVTGAGGSIGSELCRQILGLNPSRLILIELSELALYNVERELTAQIEQQKLQVKLVPLLGNAGDRARLIEIMHTYSVQTVYHAAAYKHVPIVEHNMILGIHNNALCTWNASEAALASGVELFVLISTDKAVNPTNVMGASKRLAEIILQGLQEVSTATRFCMVRFGNVLDSSGSVVPLFREQIRRGGPVTVTHPQVVRYFMTIPEAAQLVIQAGSMASGGDVFVLDMGPPVRIDDLARRMINLMGLTMRDAEHPEGDIEIRYTGLRSAEKLFEELLIGNNVGKTNHPMIMRAMEDHLPWSRMHKILDKLRAAIDAFDCPRALSLLKEGVTQYHPDEAIHDHLWTSQSLAPPPCVDPKVTSLLSYRRPPPSVSN